MKTKMSTEHWWNKTDRAEPKYSGDNPGPVPLCPKQISNLLTWDRTRAMKRRRLITWTMARP